MIWLDSESWIGNFQGDVCPSNALWAASLEASSSDAPPDQLGHPLGDRAVRALLREPARFELRFSRHCDGDRGSRIGGIL